MKDKVDVLDSPSLIVLMVSVDVKHLKKMSFPQLRNCVEDKINVLDSPYL